MRCPWLLAVTLACGRVGFEPVPARDSAADTVGVGPFGPAMPVPELDVRPVIDDPTLTADMLEIYFTGGDPDVANGEIYRATRARVDAPWSTPELVVELNSNGHENTPELTLDGLTMYLMSNRAGSEDIWVATRATRTSPWSPPVVVAPFDTGASEVAAVLASDLELFVAVGSPDYDIYVATRATTQSVWSAPGLIAELASPSFDSDAYIVDGKTLYWASGRSGSVDLWRATRTGPGLSFGQIEPIDGLNTALEEDDPWLSPDGHTMYFSRGTNLFADMKIFVATR